NTKQHKNYEVERFKSIEKNIVTSQNVEELFDRVLRLVQSQSRKSSMSLSPSLSASIANNPFFSSSTPLSTKGKKSLPSLPSSPSSLPTSVEIGNPLAMERQSLDRPLVKTTAKRISSLQYNNNKN